MTPSTASSTPERIAIGALAPQPWKNGAGLTREIAVEPRGANTGGEFAWRVSLAEVAHDAQFSAFPGVERCITLLRGAGMRLASADGTVDHRLATALAPFHFSGDIALHATLLAGACSDFNVMTRRGAWRADVAVARGTCELMAADVTLLLGVTGAWEIETGATDHDALWQLEADAALLWRAPCGPLWATPRQPCSAVLHVRLCQDGRP